MISVFEAGLAARTSASRQFAVVEPLFVAVASLPEVAIDIRRFGPRNGT